jgi:PAS domain S-box-containing protein
MLSMDNSLHDSIPHPCQSLAAQQKSALAGRRNPFRITQNIRHVPEPQESTMKLQPKLMLSMAATAFLGVLASMVVAISLGNRAIEVEVEHKIKAVLDARHADLTEYLARVQRDGRLLEIDPAIAEALRDLSKGFAQSGDKAQAQLQQAWVTGNPQPPQQREYLVERGDGSAYDRAHARHHANLREKAQIRAWPDLMLVDPKGNVVYSVKKESDFATNLHSGPWKNTGLARAVLPLLDKPVAGVASFARLAEYPPSGKPAQFYALPILHPVDGLLGVVVIQISIQRFNQIMQRHEGLGESGEAFVIGQDGWMLTDSRFEKASTILRKQLKTAAVDAVLRGESGLIAAPDYRGIPVYVGFRPLQVFPDAIGGDVRVGVITKIDRAEALAAIDDLRNTLLLAGFLIALLAIAAGMHIARTLSQPILAIQGALARLARGEATVVPELGRTDEIGAMAQAAEKFRVLAQKTEHDHWIQEHISSLSVMVSNEATLQGAAERVLHQLCELLAVPVAAFYLDDGKGNYQRIGAHGLARRSQAENSFRHGDGVLGQCAKDGQPLVLSPVPSGLSIISSGLVEFPPHELVLYPLKHKEHVLAMLELAVTESLDPMQHELLEAACSALGVHFANLQVSEHNLALLAETRRQADDLHASAHYARSLLEASLDPLVTISAEGKITDVNGATEQATGVSRNNLIGSDFADYFTEPEKAREGYREVFTQGFVTDYPLAIRHTSGRIIDVLYNASVYRDVNGAVIGVFAAARDITERKKAEAKLKEQQEILLHNNEEMKTLNEEMRSQAEEMKAQNEELKANQEELRAQQEEMAHKNQALEITGRDLNAARQEAEARALELQQASQYKSEFLANMSHELRTPLNSILILAKSLADNDESNLTPDQAESAAVIHESGSHLLTLINDILDLSKIEAGRLEIMPEDFALDDVLAYLRRVFAPLAEKKSIAFAIEVDASSPETIHGDRQRITQVLTNLLSNAVKFTEAGQVRIAVRQQDGKLQLDIHDTGVGIPADKIEHIFGVFQQLDGTTSRKYGGSGLGLAISKRLVELMGGQIVVTSTPGEGSCFSVRLPDRPASPKENKPTFPAKRPAPPLTQAAQNDDTAVATRGSILVVEDDSRLVAILARLIDTLGHPVVCVDSGEKALQQVASERPAGILLDLGLPGISGMEVLRRLKADPQGAEIPVFIMSGATDTGEAKTLGAVGFLKKPVTKDMIAAALRNMNRMNAQLQRKKVLVVENDAATVTSLRTLFARDPIELTPISEGRIALERLAAEQFDAVILDLGLDDMSGFEWLDRVCAEGRPHPPIVVYSAGELGKEELLSLRVCTETVITKGRHANERLHEEVLLALQVPAKEVVTNVSAFANPAGRHLLLVDDDVRNLYALSKALRSRGFAVTVAEDGAKALDVLRAGRFDAVLTDIMMPGIDGYELTRRIRAMGYADLPIIAVTAKAMQGDQELCLQAGATAYIPKPVDIDRLQAVLESAL